MVRTLDSSLTAAVNSVTRQPAMTLTIEDHVLHYALYQSPGAAEAWNDVCIAPDNSIVRVQLTRAGSGGNAFAQSFQFQRIIDPSQASQWSAWTTLSGAASTMFQDGGCALSNNGGVLRAFAQRGTGGNDLWVWTSTNNGTSWSGPVTVLTPPSSALTKGITSAGSNDVFFLYDVTGGEAMGFSQYSGSWSALNTWPMAPIASGAGMAATWTSSGWTVVYSDGFTLYSVTLNNTANTWNAGPIIAPATSTAIGRTMPRISFADGIYTLVCVESDTGALTGTVYSYPRLRQSADLLHWSNGMILHDMSCIYGAVAFKLPTPNSGSAGPRYYVASPATVYSALAFQNTHPAQYLDTSAAILSYQRHEQPGKPSRLEVLIDNAQGVYNSLVTTGSTYQPIGANASLVLSEGYKTGTPPTTPDVVKVGTYHLEQIHFVRSPQENHLLLVGLDITRNLDLISRYQNTYLNQTLSYLVAEICARAGLFAPSLPTTTQMSQIIPSFVLQAGQSYRHALDELCETYGLAYFLDQNEVLQFRELSASDTTVWVYQPEIELVSFGSNDARANHIIVSGKPPAGGNVGALTEAEAYDDANLHLVGVERLLHHVDQKLISTSQCAQKASFLLMQESRSQVVHTVTVPLNPALQLYDVITLIDSVAPTGSGNNVTARIVQVSMHFSAQQGIDELQMVLEGL